MKRVVVCVALSASAAVGGLAVPLTNAAAAGAPAIKTTTALDWCPGTASLCEDSQAVETLAKGTAIKQICSTSGRSGTWFSVRASDGKTGWVPATRVRRAKSVRSCSGNHAVTAELWATRPDVWGSTHPTAAARAAMKRVYSFTNFGRDNDWSGDTKPFGCVAYLASGDTYTLPDGYPTPVYDTYKSEGKVHHGGTPPAGALVFWHMVISGNDYGLLGVSLGNGQAATAPGADTAQKPVGFKSTSGNIGWVLPY